ncbi:ATP synthase F0 subunit 8 (mitochondrion) [Pectinophora gossypiella]|uniref:ATP synthase complex subunit 8 n=1 Tax=Pectinophora gossypiella TaxID=13191 RepID=A0A0K0KVD2_PECGO|nr:ATP synthase F0 subunit 8 [Pectinophora gossypiella]AIR12125.2 ATP synthase F0 subunit 8 [Pectinophora gossypiella]
MPQMMPINWLLSFFFFIIVFLLFNILNYYIFNIKMNNKINFNKKMIKNLYWKW